MKKLILTMLLCLAVASNSWAWDNRGHATIARIAERHLTPRAKANIEKYLDGQSIVYYASWMDFNRHKPPFDVTRDWHVDYWTNDLRTDAEGNPAPPISVSQIKRIIAEMPDFRELSDSLVNINIKFLVHMVGDIHSPVHVDFPTTRPVKIQYKGKEIKFHKFWDGSVIASQHYGCSPLSLAEELDRATDAEREELMSGTPDNWHDDATKYSQEAYALIVNSKVADEKYMERAYEMVNYLVPTAGYRLAKILNTIFDK